MSKRRTLNSAEAATVMKFAASLVDMDNQMNSSRLQVNAVNTQIIWLDLKQQLQKIEINQHHVLAISVSSRLQYGV